MKRSLAVVTMVVAAVLLVAGVVLGLMPVKASITQLQPQLRLLSVGCGNGYLQTTPPVVHGNLVELPNESGVYLPKDSYAQQCSSAVGWRKYGAWGLTAIGVLGLAVTFSGGAGGSSSRSGSSGSAEGRRRRKGSADAAEADSDVPGAELSAEDADPGDDPSAPAGSGGSHRRNG